MYCVKCGTKNVDNAKFCKQCGFSFSYVLQNNEHDLKTKMSDKSIDTGIETTEKAIETGSEALDKSSDTSPLVSNQSNDSTTSEQTVNISPIAGNVELKSSLESSYSSGEDELLIKSSPTLDFTDNATPSKQNKFNSVEKNTSIKKAFPKKAIILGSVVIAIIVIAVSVLQMVGRTINLNEYVKISANGFDGGGSVTAQIDWNSIEEKYGSKLKFKNGAYSQYTNPKNNKSPIDVIKDAVSMSFDNYSKLSNGDTVNCSINVSPILSENVNCKLVYKDIEFLVTDLRETTQFDAFADLTLHFRGTEPDGIANVIYYGSLADTDDFKCDKNSGLSNGDIVKVSFSKERAKYYEENCGRVPVELEKEFIVDGLDSCLTSSAMIDSEDMEAIIQQATDEFNAHVAKTWDDYEDLMSFDYIGNYLLYSKNKNSDIQNVLYFVFKAQVHNFYYSTSESYSKINDVYWYVKYDNLVVRKDGRLDYDVMDYETPSNKFYVNRNSYSHSWYYYGYPTLADLYKAVVTSNLSSFNHEDNVNDENAKVIVFESPVVNQNDSEYIIENSDSVLLSKSDLIGLTKDECRIARNEIYARHGRLFKDDELQEYFNACSWYNGYIPADSFTDDDLTAIEKANKELIVDYEKDMGYR